MKPWLTRFVSTTTLDPSVEAMLDCCVDACVAAECPDVALAIKERVLKSGRAFEVGYTDVIRLMPFAELVLLDVDFLMRTPLTPEMKRTGALATMTLGGFA